MNPDEVTIGSLFSGYGGLELGIQSVLGGTVKWHVENDEAPSRILAHRFPGVPNYGDITKVDWSRVEPVTILGGGFPCQDVSLAGLRRGMKDGTRSGLWSEFAVAIDVLRPKLVVIENVRGLLSAEANRNMESDPWGLGDGSSRPALRALGAVLGDLADLGYDARWGGVRASDAGAPHKRLRVFVLAYPASQQGRVGHGDDVQTGRGAIRREPVPGASAIAYPRGEAERLRARLRASESTGSGRGRSNDHSISPLAADTVCERFGEHAGESPAEETGTDGRHQSADHHGVRPAQDWGPYAPAITRWERTLGRIAPAPAEPTGKGGAQRLSPRFVEWMMGLPDGWVTDPEIGLKRTEQLKALGNGVVPQQAALAVRTLLHQNARREAGPTEGES